jgi:1,4-alpha-glucan branching enzyme
VREGRRKEFASFARFSDPAARERIPDPNADETFNASKIHWGESTLADHRAALELHRKLLAIRKRDIAPHVPGASHEGKFAPIGERGVAVDWVLGDGARLHLRANFGDAPLSGVPPAAGEVLHTEGVVGNASPGRGGMLGPWSGAWTLERA